MSKLPVNPDIPIEWKDVTLSEVCQLNPKVKLQDKLDVGFMPMANVPVNYFGKPKFEVRKWQDVKKGYTQFKNGDALFAKITPCFENGKAALVQGFPNGWGAGSTEYYVMRPYGDLIDPRLLLALVKTKSFLINGATNMSGSVGHKRVPKIFVESYGFPLAPLAEQKEIANRLDTLLAQVDSIKSRLDAIPDIIKRFRQSVLAAAVSGKLTEEWREGKTLNSVEEVSKTIAEQNEYLTLKKKDGLSKIYKEKVKYILEDDFELGIQESGSSPSGWAITSFYNLCILQRGYDLPKQRRVVGKYSIMSAGGKIGTHNEYKVNGPAITVGRSGSVGEVFYCEDDCWPLNTSLFVKEFNGNNKKFVYWYLKSMNLSKFSVSTAVPSLNRNEFTFEPVSLPPLEEQDQIVCELEKLYFLADKIEQKVKNAQILVNNLTQSILAKAFRGELTDEWRALNQALITGENSAEALLQKIKLERDKLQPVKKTKRAKKKD